MIDFDTKLAELAGDEYFTIATEKAGDIMRVGKQHLKFYGSFEDAKVWFCNIMHETYMHKVDLTAEDGLIEGFARGDVKFEHDMKIDQLVIAYEERF